MLLSTRKEKGRSVHILQTLENLVALHCRFSRLLAIVVFVLIFVVFAFAFFFLALLLTTAAAAGRLSRPMESLPVPSPFFSIPILLFAFWAIWRPRLSGSMFYYKFYSRARGLMVYDVGPITLPTKTTSTAVNLHQITSKIRLASRWDWERCLLLRCYRFFLFPKEDWKEKEVWRFQVRRRTGSKEGTWSG